MKNKFLIAIVVISSIIGCKSKFCKKTGEVKSQKNTGLIIANMDTSVNPKNDFYNYVNGNWMQNTKIPEDRTSWGGFGVLRKSTDYDVLSILDKAKKSKKYKQGTDQYKALLLFESILDTVSRNTIGVQSIVPVMSNIEGVQSILDLQKIKMQNRAISSPYFQFSVFSNFSNSSINALYVGTGDLGLPERDFYIDQDKETKKIREKYLDYISKMFQLLGVDKDKSKKDADIILAIETSLAVPQLNKTERRDSRNYNNPRSINQLAEMTTSINWDTAIKDLQIDKKIDSIIVLQPRYMKVLDSVLKYTPIKDLKTVIKWSTLNNASYLLSTSMEKTSWDFYSKTLNGAIKQRPRREVALGNVNALIGEAIGQLYVDEKFPPEAKAKAEFMIENIIKAYKKRIEKLTWMSDSTKVRAIEKLDKFVVKIGYPNNWEDYSKLEIKKGNSYYENKMAVNKWEFKKAIAKVGKPVDKTKWGMPPQEVNAYFNPLFNEIVFPAAILQPPFYNYKADEAVNYGGIGAVIGHEISHSFDDSGARFDASGNLSNWWTDSDLKKFQKKGKALSDQYSAIEVLDSVYINGQFTLGENIGDLGGVLSAYDGLQMYFEEKGKPSLIDGFTAEQRFFISWTTIWRTKIRDEALKNRIKTDPHSPGKVRAVQPLLNIPAFYEAFDIKKGDKMYLAPEDRVFIW